MEIAYRRSFLRWLVRTLALATLAVLVVEPGLRCPRAQADEPPSKPKPAFSADGFLASIKFLSSDALKGRGNGTPELNQAAEYIANRFRADGLKPGGDKGTYLQHFQVTVGAKLGPGNSLSVHHGESATPLKIGEDYTPLSFSHDGQVEGALIFAGYGITAPEYHYDDYKGIDAKGKMVLVLRHEPQENDEKSPFAGKQLTTHSEIVNKAINAR